MLDRLQDVFASLQRHEVKYVVIGGSAAVLHGVPRATFDLALLIGATPDNAKRLLDAFLEANLATASMTSPQELLTNEITVFSDRVRIDVQTKTPGLVFDDAWREKQSMTYRGQDFLVASRECLIASKRASGRPIDLEDVRALEAG